jgi:hypothetical protein
MKLKALVVGVVVALLSVSVAVAAPPTGKGKPQPSGPNCKPKVTVVLTGMLTGVSGTTLTMTVSHGNRWARPWVKAGTASVMVDPSTTKVRRNGGLKALTDLVSTPPDRLLVQARACKFDLGQSVLPTLTAVRIVAHPAKT